MIEVSAPGKIHLLGEHSVVYGKPALLAAINLRTHVTVTPYRPNLPKESKKLKSLRRVIEPIIKEHLQIPDIPPYHLAIMSDLPIGYHLGSSAAVSTASITALLAFLDQPFDKNVINQLAFQAEKVFHGNPSGADNTCVTHGGFIWFEKNQDPQFEQLSVHMHDDMQKFVLLDSGKPLENTKGMVAFVAKQYKSDKTLDYTFNDLASLTTYFREAIQANNTTNIRIQDCITWGERNLEILGVVSPEAKVIISQVEKLGGASKILGGGGIKRGSGMLLSWHEDYKELLTFTKDNKIKAIPIILGGEGVRIEIDDRG